MYAWWYIHPHARVQILNTRKKEIPTIVISVRKENKEKVYVWEKKVFMKKNSFSGGEGFKGGRIYRHKQRKCFPFIL